MEIITKAQKIKSIAKDWKQDYYNSVFKKWTMKDGEKIYRALCQAKTEAAVDKAIGVIGWAELKCDECNRKVEIVVVMGTHDEEYDTTPQFCLACLQKAVSLIL